MKARSFRFAAILLSAFILLPAATPIAAAVPSVNAIIVDGEAMDIGALSIDGNSYYKLRDVAYALNGTGKQFEIAFSAEDNTINLTSGNSYTPVGGELSGSAAESTASPSTVKIYLDGGEIAATAYNVAGYNYIKLRDIAATVDFGVRYYEPAYTIYIDTTAGYPDTGFFDPLYDYSLNPAYKVVYMAFYEGPLYKEYSDCFAGWAKRMNIDYQGVWSSGGDIDAYFDMISEFAEQGVDGFIHDADAYYLPRVSEIMSELGKPWMPGINEPRDYESSDGLLFYPCVTYDQYASGAAMTKKLLELKDELWPDVPVEAFGFITVDYSVSLKLHERESGAYAAWIDATGLEDNYFIADTAGVGSISADSAMQLVQTIIEANPELEHWLIAAEFDEFAIGAADATEALGLTDSAAIVAIGGEELRKLWDADTQSAWRAALTLPTALYAEPMIGALYAFMSGQATPETLWPEWVNLPAGEKYAAITTASFWIDYDNYQEYLAWSDVYAGFDAYPEYKWNGTQFPSTNSPPANFAE